MSKSAVDEQGVIGHEPQIDNKKSKQTSDFTQGKDGQVTMNVKIQSPFKNYYIGPALSLSAEDATGPFDILPHHHSFISLVLPCELMVRPPDGGEKKILISGGVMHVKADEVVVFLDV